MIYNFEPVTVKEKGDLFIVSQFGYVDLVKANQTGTLEGTIEGLEQSCNGIDEPSSIFGRPKDIFQAYRMQEFISSRGANKGESSVSDTSVDTPNVSV